MNYNNSILLYKDASSSVHIDAKDSGLNIHLLTDKIEMFWHITPANLSWAVNLNWMPAEIKYIMFKYINTISMI